MDSTLTTISKTEKEIEASLTAEEFLQYIDKAASELSKDLEVQGFRKGHVPRNIVEQKVGTSSLYNEAAELAIQATYEKALENAEKAGPGPASVRSDLGSFSRAGYIVPEVQITKLAPGNPFVYKVILRAPVFEMAEDYRDIAKKVIGKEKKDIVVEEKEVDDTLKWLAKQGTSQHPARQKGNRDSSSRGQAPAAGGSDLPKLDDEFAKNLGNFKDLEELKKGIYEGIRLEKEKKEKDRARLAMARAIIAESHIEIPEKVIDQEILKIEEEFKQNIAQMGLDFDEYLKKIKKSKEELRDGWRGQARERVGTFLVLDVIASKEDIEPEDKEVEEEAQKILNRYGSTKEAEKSIDPARLKAYVRGIIRNEKVFQFLETTT